jgi:hypothetical protein
MCSMRPVRSMRGRLHSVVRDPCNRQTLGVYTQCTQANHSAKLYRGPKIMTLRLLLQTAVGTRSLPRHDYFSNVQGRQMNNQSQPSFTQHSGVDSTGGTGIMDAKLPQQLHNFFAPQNTPANPAKNADVEVQTLKTLRQL